MQYIRLGKWFCHFRKCWNKGVWGAAVSKPAISVWHLFCLTVRQYQTHNIQYFAVRDSFSLYHITVLFRANKQWGVLWKLSICSFLVMTSHQQLMRIFIFFPGVASVPLHPHQVKVPLTASLSCISFCLRERGKGLGEAFSHWVRNKLNFFMDSKHWLDIYDQGQPFWFQLAQALRHTEQSIHTHAHTHTHTYAHIAYIHSRTRSRTQICMHAKCVLTPSCCRTHSCKCIYFIFEKNVYISSSILQELQCRTEYMLYS